MSWSPSIRSSSSSRPAITPTTRCCSGRSERGIPIWGDIELAWRLRDKVIARRSPAEWICVTGTNGKTTTTQLTAAMLVAGGLRAAPAGNIGIPVLDAIRDPQGFDVLVVELSSYQLHWINRNPERRSSRPLASVCLNIADDHLDWHGSRRGLSGRQGEGLRQHPGRLRLQPRPTSPRASSSRTPRCRRAAARSASASTCRGRATSGVVEDFLVDRAFLDERHSHALELGTLEELSASGLATPHGIANVLAAAALARAAGVEPAAVREAIREFRVDHHRTELVAERDGIRWVDDSKATNAHAAHASLSAFASVVWIAGGLLKGIDPAPLVERHASRLRGAVI